MKKILFSILILFIAQLALAHGNETTLTRPSGDYTIEFEYDHPDNVVAGELNLFVIRLLDKSGEAVPYDFSSLKISSGTEEVINASIIQSEQEGGLGSSIRAVIPKSGNFTADIGFRKGGTEIAKTSIGFQVDLASQKSGNFWAQKYLQLAGLVIGLILGFVISLLLKTRRSKETSL